MRSLLGDPGQPDFGCTPGSGDARASQGHGRNTSIFSMIKQRQPSLVVLDTGRWKRQGSEQFRTTVGFEVATAPGRHVG